MRRFNSSSIRHAKMMNSAGYGALAPRTSARARAMKLAVMGLLGCALLYGAHVLLLRSDLKYGLMIDAGSTGSRMHTYAFRDNGRRYRLASEDFHPVKPGLSAYVNNPAAAARSLEPLLERARSIVPASKRATTPVFLRATAGLRAVGVHKAERILDEVRTHLAKSGFRFDGITWATVLGGSDEGVYTWITVNTLMHRNPGNTVGILEMGGGSAQTAFVAESERTCAPETIDKKYEGVPVALYAKSDLGFGLQKARATALEAFERDHTLGANPCFNKGAAVQVQVPFTTRNITVTGTSDFAQCRLALERGVIAPRTNSSCSCGVCGYDGVVRPKPTREYVAIAFYIERTVGLGLATPLRVEDIRRKGQQICSLSLDEVRRQYPHVANGKAEDLCLDLAFIVEHLEHAHGITESEGTVLHVKQKIEDYELGWALGAMFDEMNKLRK